MPRSHRRCLAVFVFVMALVPAVASAGVSRDKPFEAQAIAESLARLWEKVTAGISALWAKDLSLPRAPAPPPGGVTRQGDCGAGIDPTGGCRP